VKNNYYLLLLLFYQISDFVYFSNKEIKYLYIDKIIISKNNDSYNDIQKHLF
jgi:predicted GNAT superfamily acetyltransferase